MTVQERDTIQKRAVIEYLKSVKTHPTAEIVLSEVRKKISCISQGTVYRILENLNKKGEIQAIETKNAVHFDGDATDHAHFICNVCNRVYDVCDICYKLKHIKNKKTKVGTIKNYKVNFYGICNFCK